MGGSYPLVIVLVNEVTADMNYLLVLGIVMVSIFHVSESEPMMCKSPGVRCPPGYRQHKRDCIDIDECKNEPCTEPYTECINTEGGYNCTCCEGFEYVDAHEICRPKECPEGWERFGMNCYQYRDIRNSFEDAELDCQSDGAHLISISDYQEKYYFEKFMAEQRANGNDHTIMWIGLARLANMTQIEAFFSQNLIPYFIWHNGEAYTGFPPILSARLFYGEYDLYCVAIWGNSADDTWLETCKNGHNNYRCQRDKDESGSCGDWFEVNDYCYNTNANPDDDTIYIPYLNATKDCESMGGRLPIFREGDNMTGLLDQGVAGWLGLETFGRPYDTLIARGMSELFRWTDGTPYDKAVIYFKEFRVTQSSINVGYFMPRDVEETYYLPSLDRNRLPYICEKPI